jgi:hypothetical protein
MLGLFATGRLEFDVMGERLEELVSSGAIAGSLAAVFAVLVFLAGGQISPISPSCLATGCHGSQTRFRP